MRSVARPIVIALGLTMASHLSYAAVLTAQEGRTWSGTIEETVEFGLTSIESRETRRVFGPAGAPSFEAHYWQDSLDFDGERTVRITVEGNRAHASVVGRGTWSVANDAIETHGACQRTWIWSEMVSATPVRPGDAAFAVSIGDGGHYSIDASGDETVAVTYDYQWWFTDTCEPGAAPPTEPPAGELISGTIVTDSHEATWTRPWDVSVGGTATTCDPTHLVGSTADPGADAGYGNSGWRRAGSGDADLLGWFYGSLERAGIIDPSMGRPRGTPLLRVERTWDLRRDDTGTVEVGGTCPVSYDVSIEWSSTGYLHTYAGKITGTIETYDGTTPLPADQPVDDLVGTGKHDSTANLPTDDPLAEGGLCGIEMVPTEGSGDVYLTGGLVREGWPTSGITGTALLISAFSGPDENYEEAYPPYIDLFLIPVSAEGGSGQEHIVRASPDECGGEWVVTVKWSAELTRGNPSRD